MIKNLQTPVFCTIHVRVIAKFFLWDTIVGSFIFWEIRNYSHSHLTAMGGSTIAIEGINQLLKRTETGRKMIKY